MVMYSSENEGLDTLRRFFTKNGKLIAMLLVLGLCGLFGWKYWQNHQMTKQVQSSEIYQGLTAKLTEIESDIQVEAEKFTQDNSNSYSVFTALQLAQSSVKAGNYQQAAERLLAAQSKTKDENLHALTALRLARVQLQEKQYDAALKTLTSVKGTGWIAQVEDVRGDILVNKGDLSAAKAAYSKGIESDASQALQALMRIKLNNLSG